MTRKHPLCRTRVAVALAATLVATLTGGCPRSGVQTTNSGSTRADVWVSFDVVERGSGNPLQAYIWVKGSHEDFETVVSGDDSPARFHGFGKTADGYNIPFTVNQTVQFVAWAPEHELTTIDTKLKRGENMVYVELRKTEVEDDRVPDQIRMDVLERLPTEAPKTGS